jgi:hypothetical protein
MSDKSENSQKMFAKISGQMGMTPLSSTTSKIDPDSTDNDSVNIEVEGVVDDQAKSQNPLLQYAVASAIGLLFLGIPLSLILGIGGGQNQSTKETPTDKDKTAKQPIATPDSPEVERLKTQVALDLQSKATQQAQQAQQTGQTQQPAQIVKPVQPAQAIQPAQAVQPIKPVVPTKTAPPIVAAQPEPQPVPIRSTPTRSIARVGERFFSGEIDNNIHDATVNHPTALETS